MEKIIAAMHGAAFTLALMAVPALAQQAGPFQRSESPAVMAMAGAWEIINADASRRCRITFNRTSTSGEFMLVGIPPACRMSLPQLGRRNGWALATDGNIHFGPGGEEPVLIFTRGAGASYVAAGGLKLEPAGRSVHGEQRTQVIATATAAATPTAPENAARIGLAGNYTITRSPAEIGCALSLQTVPVRITNGGENIWAASLANDCRDDGLKTFSPAGWRLENGRIFLVAKKGHSIGFTTEQNGARWFKDPPAGRPLFMSRAAN